MTDNSALRDIARALERLAPCTPTDSTLDQGDAFVWQAESQTLRPVHGMTGIPLPLLIGIQHVKEILLGNTQRFARGLPANNALLWGARGMGKSSLIKSVHRAVNELQVNRVVLIEIHREDISSLTALMNRLRSETRRIILMCDDLSFEHRDDSLKSLKAVLEGGIEGRPDNVIFYATSNRRHLTPRDMIENEQSRAVHPSEAIEEKISLSDRFGLWLGFHGCDQPTYLSMVESYAAFLDLPIDTTELHAQAIEWQATRGARSGRVARQFITDLAGRLNQQIFLPP